MATPTALDRELLEVEKTFWDAIKKKDRARIGELTGDTFIMTMSEGITPMSSRQFTDMMVADDMKIRGYQLDEQGAEVSRPLDHVAIVAYKAHLDYEREGRPDAIDAFYTTTWIREGGRWRAVASSESKSAG